MPNFITSHGFFLCFQASRLNCWKKPSDLWSCIKYQTIDLPPFVVVGFLGMVFPDFLTGSSHLVLFFWIRFLLWLKRHTLLLQQNLPAKSFSNNSQLIRLPRERRVLSGAFFSYFFGLFISFLLYFFFFESERGGLGGFLSANEIVRLMALATASRSVGRRSVSFPTVLLCKHPRCYVCYSFNVCEKFLMQLNYVLPSCLYK